MTNHIQPGDNGSAGKGRFEALTHVMQKWMLEHPFASGQLPAGHGGTIRLVGSSG
jgi:hypothetical protein